MARLYPRFIYSDPQDTKSKGPFIIHTLFPQLIAKVTYADDGYHYVDVLDIFTPADKEKIDQVVYSMHDWYTGVRMKQANLRDDFYERSSDIAQRLSRLDSFFTGMVSISMVFRPVMGARLDVGSDNWKVSVDIADNDTYDSVVMKLKQEYQNKYLTKPDWSI